MRQYTLYLTDIVDALEKIEEFAAGMTYNEFLLDDKTQSAVIRKEDPAACPGEIPRRFLARDGRDAG